MTLFPLEADVGALLTRRGRVGVVSWAFGSETYLRSGWHWFSTLLTLSRLSRDLTKPVGRRVLILSSETLMDRVTYLKRCV